MHVAWTLGVSPRPFRFNSIATAVVGATALLALVALGWRELHPSSEAAPLWPNTGGTARTHGLGLGMISIMVATMLPVAIAGARHVARNSFRSRRAGAVLLFLGSFSLVWIGVGIAAGLGMGLLATLPSPAGMDSVGIAAIAVAAGWQVTPWKLTALRDCHRAVPLPPRGWAATRGSLKYGFVYGARCAQTCGGLMLPMLAAPDGHVVLGVFATVLALAERRFRLLRRRPELVSIGVVGVALAVSAWTAPPNTTLIEWICGIPRK